MFTCVRRPAAPQVADGDRVLVTWIRVIRVP